MSTNNSRAQVASGVADVVPARTGPIVLRDVAQMEWQDVEEKALVEFILLFGEGDTWPATKDVKYWESAAKFVHERSGLRMRTGEHYDMLLVV